MRGGLEFPERLRHAWTEDHEVGHGPIGGDMCCQSNLVVDNPSPASRGPLYIGRRRPVCRFHLLPSSAWLLALLCREPGVVESQPFNPSSVGSEGAQLKHTLKVPTMCGEVTYQVGPYRSPNETATAVHLSQLADG